MTSCTNEEPRYFGIKTYHIKANAFTIETVGVYVPLRVPTSHRQVPSEQACESTGGVRADRCAGCQGGVRVDRYVDSPGGEPFDQAPPPTFVPTAPTFNAVGLKSTPHYPVSLQSFLFLSDSPVVYLQLA